MKKLILCGLSALFAGALSLSAQGQAASATNTAAEIELAKQKIAEFVKTRQLIATRRTEWLTYQEVTQRRLEAFSTEVADLARNIEEAEQRTSEAERNIAERQDQIEALMAATRVVSDALPALEDKIAAMSEYFPKPLRSRVDPLLRNLGRQRSPSERMSVVVGVMNEADRFNANFNLASDQKTLSNGETVLVGVLYVGLGMAYYANETGTIGGFGVPAKGGWQWTEDNSIASAVRRAIQFHNGEVKPAALVELPVFLSDNK
jgi:hypothetical protein